MRFILLCSCLLLLPFLSKGQDANTIQQMKAMGFEPVDLQALRQQQNAQPCSTCPISQPVQRAAVPPAEELQNLKAMLPRLQQAVVDSQADPTISAAMRQKHQTALDRTRQRIQQLEQSLAPQPASR